MENANDIFVEGGGQWHTIGISEQKWKCETQQRKSGVGK